MKIIRSIFLVCLCIFAWNGCYVQNEEGIVIAGFKYIPMIGDIILYVV